MPVNRVNLAKPRVLSAAIARTGQIKVQIIQRQVKGMDRKEKIDKEIARLKELIKGCEKAMEQLPEYEKKPGNRPEYLQKRTDCA